MKKINHKSGCRAFTVTGGMAQMISTELLKPLALLRLSFQQVLVCCFRETSYAPMKQCRKRLGKERSSDLL
jgi:hypothetical protein